MIDRKLTELADRMIRVQFQEREEQLQRDIALVQSKFGQRNLGRSSLVVEGVYDLCARDIELRALIVWQNLATVLSKAGVSPPGTLAEDLKKVVGDYLTSIYTYPAQSLDRVVNLVGIGLGRSLTEARDRAIAKVDAQIDLFVLGAEVKEKSGDTSQQVFNIFSPIGAIQTGPNATATIVQKLSPQDREALRDALDRVKQGLGEVDKLPGYEKDEVLDLIEEGRAEVDKSKPNSMRVTSVFSAIAAAIQTAGSLQPAYQGLKAALLPLGILLP